MYSCNIAALIKKNIPVYRDIPAEKSCTIPYASNKEPVVEYDRHYPPSTLNYPLLCLHTLRLAFTLQDTSLGQNVILTMDIQYTWIL